MPGGGCKDTSMSTQDAILLCPPGSCLDPAVQTCSFAGELGAPPLAWNAADETATLLAALRAGYGTTVCSKPPENASDDPGACWPCWDPAMRDLPRGLSLFCAQVCDRAG